MPCIWPTLMQILKGKSLAGSKTREAVIDYGYSQKEVSEFLGVHYSTINRQVNKADNARNKT